MAAVSSDYVRPNDVRVDIARLLIESGANVNAAQFVDGSTVLMLAAKSGLIEIVREMIERGALTGVRNAKRETARDIAARHCLEALPLFDEQRQNASFINSIIGMFRR
jgi:ankyrin repeat protein